MKTLGDTVESLDVFKVDAVEHRMVLRSRAFAVKKLSCLWQSGVAKMALLESQVS